MKTLRPADGHSNPPTSQASIGTDAPTVAPLSGIPHSDASGSDSSLTPHYEPRFYRDWTSGQHPHPLRRFNVTQGESDLDLYVTEEISGVEVVLAESRRILVAQIESEPEFLESLTPLEPKPEDPPMIVRMKQAAQLAGVGPMAAVAGAVAEAVGTCLRGNNPDVIVENGGDLYLDLSTERRVLIYAGDSPLSGRLALHIKPEDTPLGICTSSGRFGHSLSFGRAHAAVILSKNPALADAVATATANRVSTPEDIDPAVKFAAAIPGVTGVLVILDEHIGLWGEVTLKPVK